MENLVKHPQYTDYACDSEGNVYSLKFGKVKRLKLCDNSHGYLIFNIWKDKKHFSKKVHQFVYECITQSIPIWSIKTGDGLTLNHKDENKLNNRFDNLEIKTHRENNQLQKRYKTKENGLPKGVYFDKRRIIYFVMVSINNHNKYFGAYSSPEEAYNKSKEVYLEIFGEILID